MNQKLLIKIKSRINYSHIKAHLPTENNINFNKECENYTFKELSHQQLKILILNFPKMLKLENQMKGLL